MNDLNDPQLRLLAILLTVGASAMSSGCVFESAFAREVRQTRLQVEALEQRVGRLEAGAPGSSGAASSGELVVASGSEAAYAGGSSIAGSAGRAARGGFAFPPIFSRNALGKLARGFVNTVTGWVEIPKRMQETTAASGVGAGLTFGLLRGVGYGFVRTLAGVYEVVTFPFPAPPDYRPVMQPEYVFTSDASS